MPMTPGWRVWLGTVITGVAGSVGSVYVSVRLAEQNSADQIRAAQAAASEQRRVTCDLVARILAAYEENPPVSETGRNVVDAWREQYRVIGCPPRK